VTRRLACVSLIAVPLVVIAACSSSSSPSNGSPDASHGSSSSGSKGSAGSSGKGSGTSGSGTSGSSGSRSSGGSGSGTSGSSGATLSFTPASSIAITQLEPSLDGGPGTQFVGIDILNNAALTCSLAQSLAGKNVNFSNVAGVELVVASASGTVAPGTFTVGGATATAEAIYSAFDASCVQTQHAGTSGSITISAISATSVSGSYDVTFGSAGSVTGTFNTDFCTTPDAGTAQSDAGPTCMAPP